MMPTKFEVAILRNVACSNEHIRNHDDNVDENDDVADIIDVPTATFSTLQHACCACNAVYVPYR